MGGAVSSGRDNNELIDNLVGSNYIRTRCVERVFRALDRADYMIPEDRDQAYKDLAWRNGPLHMSAPCIYSEVMEGLELRPGLSFLNVGSGTGYLSTLVGLIIGSGGISHGIEVYPHVVEYATKKMSQFLENSPTLDEFDFCEPKFYTGNGLCLAPLQAPYDRLYCGAGCPEEYENYFKQLIKVGGLLVMPLNETLVQIRRVSETDWVSRRLLNVSFATLRVPKKDEAAEIIKLEEQTPPRLQVLARGVVRGAMRAGLLRRHPELREPPQRQPPAKKSCPRRICIPIEDDSDVEGLNALHNLDRAGGAQEMNALLSLVLSMGQNRVAGALRFDPLDSPAESDDDADRWPDDEDDGDDGDDGSGDGGSGGSGGSGGQGTPRARTTVSNSKESSPSSSGDQPAPREPEERAGTRTRRGLLTFEFRDSMGPERVRPPAPRAAGDSRPDTETKQSQDSEPKSGPSTEGAEANADDEDSPGVPAEVEIYLGKSSQASISRTLDAMDWDREDEDLSTDEESPEDDSRTKEDNRQKLDSGIGEETTPSSDSSPMKSDSKTDESDADGSPRSDSLTDEVNDKHDNGRRRLQKRARGLPGQSAVSPAQWPSASASAGAGAGAGGRRRAKRRAASPPRGGPDARRVRLSVLMKRGVKELPLPHALKKYVNLGRCFEF